MIITVALTLLLAAEPAGAVDLAAAPEASAAGDASAAAEPAPQRRSDGLHYRLEFLTGTAAYGGLLHLDSYQGASRDRVVGGPLGLGLHVQYGILQAGLAVDPTIRLGWPFDPSHGNGQNPIGGEIGQRNLLAGVSLPVGLAPLRAELMAVAGWNLVSVLGSGREEPRSVRVPHLGGRAALGLEVHQLLLSIGMIATQDLGDTRELLSHRVGGGLYRSTYLSLSYEL
jgi:hypothetical protein